MAFVNAYLTEEEKTKFNEAQIPDPRWNLPKYCLEPWTWTVDKERGIALINCGIENRDEHNIETFILIDTQIGKNEILSFKLKTANMGSDALAKKYGVNMVLIWHLISINGLENSDIVSSVEEFVDLLSEALTAYGSSGKPGFIPNVKALIEIDKRGRINEC